MMTWYYYIKEIGPHPLDGYWSPTPPCYSTDHYLACIDAAEMPTESPIQMQQSGISRQAKALNPYNG